ncbi:hypothetical protein BDQ17DRAFT_1074697 [Cyathus striatus]|nr:hypothetical protein BDQ17DRAFT_1074697 [Cyathus striatus]
MFLRDHQEHFTRAELAFAFARADSLARNIPITDISSIIYGLPGVGGPPQLPEIDVLGPTRESKPAEKTSSPHLHSTTKGDSPFVYALIEAHLTSWYGLVNHRFAKKMADGTASLDQFRYYMVQDMLYLQGWVRDKMTGAAQADFSTLETVAQKLPSSVRYCLDVNDMCVYDLGIPQEVIDNTQPSDILNTAREFHSNVARNDDWFALHVALLPCILGYYEIAINIIGDPKTERNTLYHTLWTVLNADVSYAKAYIQFVNDNLERYYTPEAMARWSKIFGDACDLEIKFFDVGRELPYPYTIVPPGCYKIINFRNHCALESPSNYYKLPQDNTTVQTGLKGIPVGHHRPIFTAPISDSDFQKVSILTL